MCIISSPVKSVSDTRIMVLPSRGPNDAPYQTVIYACELETEQTNTMILPCWNPSGDADNVILHDMSSVTHFFNMVNNALFHHQHGFAKSNVKLGPSASTLKVVKVGGFDVSIVPTLYDMNRLNIRLFGIYVVPELIPTLQTLYPTDFSFIVAKFTQGRHTYHPLAFSHTRPQKLFIPTYHLHRHNWASTMIKSTMTYITHSKPREDFDHRIYVCGSGTHNSSAVDKWYTILNGWLKDVSPPIKTKAKEMTSLAWLEISGKFKNKDIELEWSKTIGSQNIESVIRELLE
jgi:hypothetical protein